MSTKPGAGQGKGYPFEVPLPDGLAVCGVVLSDHVKNLDWQARKAARICAVPDQVLSEVWERLKTLLEGNE